MKVETRGKYPGVKLHLEVEEVNEILALTNPPSSLTNSLVTKMGKKIRDLLEENPGLLQERTPEQVKAILVKEAEKAALQLSTLNQTGQFKKLNQDALKKALLKYVEG